MDWGFVVHLSGVVERRWGCINLCIFSQGTGLFYAGCIAKGASFLWDNSRTESGGVGGAMDWFGRRPALGSACHLHIWLLGSLRMKVGAEVYEFRGSGRLKVERKACWRQGA